MALYKKILLLSLLLLFSSFVGCAKVYLVSIGVSDYPNTEYDLRLPVLDAKLITQVYKEKVEMEYVILLDSMATFRNIKKSMNTVFAKAKEDDVVVLYYSGHGYANGLFVYDGPFEYGEIRRSMARSKCRNKMMFVDACYSGRICSENRPDSVSETRSKQSNVMLFLSSRSNESSYEGSNLKNSFFTTFLARGLRGSADANHDCKITAHELFRYVSANVHKFSAGKQHPKMWGNFSSDMPVLYRLLEKSK